MDPQTLRHLPRTRRLIPFTVSPTRAGVAVTPRKNGLGAAARADASVWRGSTGLELGRRGGRTGRGGAA